MFFVLCDRPINSWNCNKTLFFHFYIVEEYQNWLKTLMLTYIIYASCENMLAKAGSNIISRWFINTITLYFICTSLNFSLNLKSVEINVLVPVRWRWNIMIHLRVCFTCTSLCVLFEQRDAMSQQYLPRK